MSRISKSLSERHNTKTFIELECSVRTGKILVSQYGPRACALTPYIYPATRQISIIKFRYYTRLSPPHPSFLPLQKPNADESFLSE